MMRKIQSDDLRLEVVHPDAAGIDIGNESHYVAVPPTRDTESVRRFGCTTAELRAMAGWLKQCGIRTVAMQSTGVYWIAVYDILEQAGLEVYLVNARETKNLPGRKSDVQESQWLMKLHTYGLLRNSFRPSQEIRTMRTYWRQRSLSVWLSRNRGLSPDRQRLRRYSLSSDLDERYHGHERGRVRWQSEPRIAGLTLAAVLHHRSWRARTCPRPVPSRCRVRRQSRQLRGW